MDNSNTTLYTLQPQNNPTLSPDQQKTPPESHTDAAAQPLRVGRRRRRTNKISKDGGEDEVEKKIVALQKIVPGGERLPVEELFHETAEYILALESQVKALRFLAALVQASANKKRMLGGG